MRLMKISPAALCEAATTCEKDLPFTEPGLTMMLRSVNFLSTILGWGFHTSYVKLHSNALSAQARSCSRTTASPEVAAPEDRGECHVTCSPSSLRSYFLDQALQANKWGPMTWMAFRKARPTHTHTPNWP